MPSSTSVLATALHQLHPYRLKSSYGQSNNSGKEESSAEKFLGNHGHDDSRSFVHFLCDLALGRANLHSRPMRFCLGVVKGPHREG